MKNALPLLAARDTVWLGLLVLQPLGGADQDAQVLLGQAAAELVKLGYQLGLLGVFIEEIPGRHAQIFTDIQELTQGRSSSAGGYALHITFAVTKIQTHLILRDIFPGPKGGDPVTDKLHIHRASPLAPFYNNLNGKKGD